MNWIKLAYHSFLTIVLGVTLSVCSNVMETDDFEIEAIANSSTVKYGSVVRTGDNQTINFSSSFTDIPIINATQYNSSTGLGSNITSITDITKSSFRVFSSSGTTKIYYSAVGK